MQRNHKNYQRLIIIDTYKTAAHKMVVWSLKVLYISTMTQTGRVVFKVLGLNKSELMNVITIG